MNDEKSKSTARGAAGDVDADRVEADGAEADAPEAAGGRWPVDRLLPVLEALLFAAADPLSTRKICEVVDGVTSREVRAALGRLESDCKRRGIRLVEVAGGWQLRTAPEHHGYVKQLFRERPFRLTRASLETLAVIAYRQPVTRAEIEAIRGVDSSGVLEGLVERRLVRIAGRRDVPGRPLVYATTPRFLEVFGLKDLKSLPTLGEISEDLSNMAEQAGFAGERGVEQAAILPLEAGEDEATEGEQTERPGFPAGKAQGSPTSHHDEGEDGSKD